MRETEVLRDGGVEDAEGMRKADFAHDVDRFVAAGAPHRTDEIAEAID